MLLAPSPGLILRWPTAPGDEEEEYLDEEDEEEEPEDSSDSDYGSSRKKGKARKAAGAAARRPARTAAARSKPAAAAGNSRAAARKVRGCGRLWEAFGSSRLAVQGRLSASWVAGAAVTEGQTAGHGDLLHPSKAMLSVVAAVLVVAASNTTLCGAWNKDAPVRVCASQHRWTSTPSPLRQWETIVHGTVTHRYVLGWCVTHLLTHVGIHLPCSAHAGTLMTMRRQQRTPRTVTLTVMPSPGATALLQPAGGAASLQQQLHGGRGGKQQQKQMRTSRCALVNAGEVHVCFSQVHVVAVCVYARPHSHLQPPLRLLCGFGWCNTAA